MCESLLPVGSIPRAVQVFPDLPSANGKESGSVIGLMNEIVAVTHDVRDPRPTNQARDPTFIIGPAAFQTALLLLLLCAYMFLILPLTERLHPVATASLVTAAARHPRTR